MLTPEQLAASGTEDGIQRAFLQSLIPFTGTYPCLLWFYAVPNGGSRGDAKQARLNGAIMKAGGVKKGIFDLCLPWPASGFAGLYIEFKRPDGKGGLSIEQKAFSSYLAGACYCQVITDDWREALALTRDYLADCLRGRPIFDSKNYLKK